MTIPEMRKAVAAFIAGLAGVVAQVIAANVVSGTALHWAQVLLATATAVGAGLSAYQVENAPAPPTDGAAEVS